MTTFIESLDHWSAEWWRWFAAASWQSAVVALAVLGTVMLGRRWPAPLRYGLLLVALVKFLIPPMLWLPTGLLSVASSRLPIGQVESISNSLTKAANPAGHFDPIGFLDGAATQGAARAEVVPVAPPEARFTAPVPSKSKWLSNWRWQTLLLLTHLAGSCAAVLWLSRQWGSLRKLRERAKPIKSGPLHEVYVQAARSLELRRGPALLLSGEATTPLAFGVVAPAVLLPATAAERLPLRELKIVLAHELAHFRRGDLLVNWLQLGLLAIWWFHPFFWLVHRAIRKVREDCCDDLLLARGLTSENAYCDVLLRTAKELASPTPSAVALAFGENLHPLGRRLRRIMDRGLKRAPGLSLSGAVAICTVAGGLLPGLRSQSRPANPAAPHAKDPAKAARDPDKPTPITPRFTNWKTARC